ncbi:hypothetical protein [Halosolutus halophilus]|uniref:hypothetical protein n=1 Tax=Halosolutus halophilus TaxID=1552990 RepID=UPI0022353053|nr:hypothetical protein [Halosolutus halophilus]
MTRVNPPPAELGEIEETYEEIELDSLTFALISHPEDGYEWIMSDYTLPIEQ